MNPRLASSLTACSTRGLHSYPFPMVLSQQQAYTPALWPGALCNVETRPHLFHAFCRLLHNPLLIWVTTRLLIPEGWKAEST